VETVFAAQIVQRLSRRMANSALNAGTLQTKAMRTKLILDT